MIGRLKGIIAAIDDDSILIDVGGVGYEAFCTPRLQAALEVGRAAEIIIETHVREDHFHLYGFLSTYERAWFRKLTTVQRLGNKAALAILNAMSPEQVSHAILAKDTAAFSRISGIGPKLAERIVAELKDKVVVSPQSFVVSDKKNKSLTASDSPLATHLEDAISALVSLGYGRSEAYSAAATAAKEAGPDASVDALLKRSLKELA